MMKKLSRAPGFLTLLFSGILCSSHPIPAADAPASGSLQAGDLVGICGDSITEQKAYSLFMTSYFVMCQPQPKLQAVQFGWGGETAPGFVPRMVNDVLPFKPTVVTTCYGMNDGGYSPTTPEKLDLYRKNMTTIVQTFKEHGIRFIVVGTPGAVDTFYFRKGTEGAATMYNQTLADLSKVAKEVAEKEGVGFADVHDPMLEVMAKAKAKYGADFSVAGNDGIHPPYDGHVIMAYAFLKALGCDGQIGTITVDLKADQATATPGTTVISCAKGTVALESTRYPYCFFGDKEKDPTSTRSILPFLPFNQDLNRYLLVVKNAPGKSLKVTWGTTSKTFPAADLEKGVNLAAEFPDNPFSAPFQAVQQKLTDQENFETLASKNLLHSLLSWQTVPGAKEVLDDAAPKLSEKLLAKWKMLSEASSAAVVPVKHEIKIEIAP